MLFAHALPHPKARCSLSPKENTRTPAADIGTPLDTFLVVGSYDPGALPGMRVGNAPTTLAVGAQVNGTMRGPGGTESGMLLALYTCRMHAWRGTVSQKR